MIEKRRIDRFRVKCFQTAYKAFGNEKNPTLRFFKALEATSDTVLDMDIPSVRAGFNQWWKEYGSKGRRKTAT
jgi:hypothetical protein